jgi:S1-C subfamily serine protease
MNEQPDPQETPDDATAAPVAPTPDSSVTQQHPLTQPVPQVQPPTQPPYPGQPVVAAGPDLFPPAAQPSTDVSWAPAPGAWATAPAPGWGPSGPTPAPGGWGAGVGGGQPPTTWPPSPYGYYPVPPTAPAKQRNHKGQVAVVASLVAVLALLLGAGIGHATWPTATTAATASNPTGGSGSGSSSGGSNFPFGSGSGSDGSGSSSSGGSTSGVGAPSDVTAIAAKISPALVDINTNLSYQNEQAAGTGIVLTSNGEILTNNHVIDGATSISVTDIGNGQTYKANVVGYDRTGDVAVIQLVGASGLQTASIATGTAKLGQGVVGVGNAGGTGGQPSSAGGSVTALNQSITASDSGGGNSENLTGLIEMNADIQPGDSGGSLVNSSGQVLGMDTAASTSNSDGGGTSQAYAIPIATALSIAHSIEAGRASSTIHIGATGFLGVQVQDSSASLGGSSGDSTGNATTGALVDGTLQGSPGAGAGLVQGDAITGVDNTPVNNSTDLSNALESHHPGDVIHLEWTDQSGASHTSSVTLAVGPPA